ncbi:iron-containing alcohol dehydrogenase family protein [Salinirussus salinus]|uniref:iron-containing alcohol dehydrogenase family protein n=1 Tax=Salinirussus salinus TaxID=1198300 RepID=UPI00135AFFCE|nr:iron-containing alcohol dehydrogenase family protein [Salinirussus salinus]
MTDYRFAYEPGAVRYGEGAAGDLDDELEALGAERALVVAGQTVGTTPEVIDPVREGLGDRLAGVLAETTPDKLVSTALDVVEAMEETGADALVGLGGGSSIDVSKAAAAIASKDSQGVDRAAVGTEMEETGTIAIEGEAPPVVAVPTTLAGADLSQVAGINADPATCPVAEPVDGGVSDPALMSAAVVGDPELVATTPPGILRASAMNGFDKGVETLYTSAATPFTDATAVRGLDVLTDALPDLGERVTVETAAPSLEGLLLVQYGISRPDGGTLGLIHAFGHGLTAYSDIQQGAAHAVVAPHALRYLFGEVEGRRELLAEAFGVGDAGDPAEAVVEAVADVRDGLGLPARLRDTEGPEPDQFEDVARAVVDDPLIVNLPEGLELTVEDMVGVLEDAH